MNKRISDFILNLHDGSMHLAPDEFQNWALREIRQIIDFDFAIWGAGDGRSRELDTAIIINQVDTLFSTWEEVKHEDPYANLVIGNTGKTWRSEQLPAFQKSRAYNEHWKLYQAKNMISTMEVAPQSGLHIFVTLARASLGTAFSHKDIQMKALITQHLFLAACHNDVHYLRSCQAPSAFADRRGQLHATLPEFTAMLANELGKHASRQLPPKVNAALWQTGHFSSQGLSLNAVRLNNRLLVRAGLRPQVSLSPREREIAWSYATGRNHKEVAQRFNISPTTVRTHLARIYQKLKISDKGSLAIWLKENRI